MVSISNRYLDTKNPRPEKDGDFFCSIFSMCHKLTLCARNFALQTLNNIVMIQKKLIDRHFLNFEIAGFTYWDGCMALEELKVGTRLILAREEENKFDPYAVAIYYGDYKLGFVPRKVNQQLCQFIDLGYGDIFDARVQRVSPERHMEDQVGVVIYIKERVI